MTHDALPGWQKIYATIESAALSGHDYTYPIVPHLEQIRKSLIKAEAADKMAEALMFYADDASYQFIHGATSYMPIEVDDGYKAKEALSQIRDTKPTINRTKEKSYD